MQLIENRKYKGRRDYTENLNWDNTKAKKTLKLRIHRNGDRHRQDAN